jgi:hypothetical protein
MIATTSMREDSVIVRACCSLSLKTLTVVFPLIRFFTSEKSTNKVVVLIPPPHEPGDAPMNMRRMRIDAALSLNIEKSTVLNPAVRLVID